MTDVIYTFAVIGLGVSLAWVTGEAGRLRNRARRRREAQRFYAPFGWRP